MSYNSETTKMFLHNSLTCLHIFWIIKKTVSSVIVMVLKHVHYSLIILPSNGRASVLSSRTWMATNGKNVMEMMGLLSLGGTKQCSFQPALSECSLLKPSYCLQGSPGQTVMPHVGVPADSPQLSKEGLKVTLAPPTI